MAAEAVLFPPQPLFMVDRSWQRRGRKVSPSSREFENSSRVPEITITVLNGNKTSQKRSSGTATAPERAPSKPSKVNNIQFLSYEPHTLSRKDKRTKATKSVKNNKRDSRSLSESAQNSALVPAGSQSADEASDRSTLSITSISRSTSPCYTVIDPEVSSFEKFIVYYPTRLADAIFPMSQYLNFEYNTLQKIWLPVAATDEVLLHTILFASASHLHNVSDSHDFKDASLLMKVILDRLNRRLRNKTLSDATIGAVSCLAMCENTLGKHESTAMHMSGMAEMIKVRGGMSAIRHELQMKIYREMLKLEGTHNSQLELLLKTSRVSATLSDLLLELSQLSFAIEHAMDSQARIDPLMFEEELLCLQYNLLIHALSTSPGLEKAYTLGALIYLQTLTRSAPFMKSSSEALSKELKLSLLNLDTAEVSSPLRFWLFIMGGLVSSETSEKDWFRQRLRVCQGSQTDVVIWESMKSQLMAVLWVERIHDNLGEALWVDLLPPMAF
ncbi:hypothetical protein LTR84_003106 [Exophiala bonariae]|uniref:Uncharacterized protein n=1 Tax=Exophiala bonariae TaxID=1690606 RepID=A0AAV9NBK9_9EURO|nr:hypothetical protein LTR84_003106 [Exophiala bonariae]